MPSPYEAFETDPELESGEGVTLDYGDFRITIHRAGGANRRFARVLEAKMKPYRRQLQTGTLDDEVAQRLLVETYAEAVVVGWKGVKDRTGKTMACTRDNVVRLFTDLPELFRDVQEQAQSLANFRRAELEADAKNSQTASPSSSSGASSSKG